MHRLILLFLLDMELAVLLLVKRTMPHLWLNQELLLELFSLHQSPDKLSKLTKVELFFFSSLLSNS